MKHLVPIIVILLLVSTSFVGVGNQVEEQVLFKEKKIQTTEKFLDESKDSLWSLLQDNFWSASNRPCYKCKNINNFNNFNIQDDSPYCDHYAYISFVAYGPPDCWIEKFKLSGGDSSCICYDYPGTMDFFSSVAWKNDHEVFVVKYQNGELYKIDLEICDLIEIGGGGVGLNGLTYDPTNAILYGCSSNKLYEIDSSTGEQELIGSFNNGQTMIEIACDANGVIYGWDVKFSGDSCLYTIDKETGEATQVGGMGVTLLYAQDGDFCRECDILYLAAWIYNPVYGGYLCTVNKSTGELIIGSGFDTNAECTFFAVRDTNELPIPIFNWTPLISQPGQEIIFNASESYDSDGYIKLYEWDWDNDGVFDEKNYTSPLATHTFEEDGYYPVTLKVHDNNFTYGSITKTVRVGNEPPSSTPEIDGPRVFKVGESGEYTYKFISSDLDNDSLFYDIDWFDGTVEEIGPYESGEEIFLNATINAETKGTCNIFRVKAIDEHDAESDWATLEITVPKSYNLFINWLDRFPLLQRLLEGLIR